MGFGLVSGYLIDIPTGWKVGCTNDQMIKFHVNTG